MLRVKRVTPISKFVVRLELNNGDKRTIDLEPFLFGPIFRKIRNNRSEFLKLHVDPVLGTIVWDNGADIDPDVLIGIEQPEWAKREAARHADIMREPMAKYPTKAKKLE